MSESNVVVLTGTVTGTPQRRELADGRTVVQFDVTVRDDTGAVGVPVAWFDPPTAGVEAEQRVVVLGAVRRRFFRASGATQSRTEVVAEQLIMARKKAEVRRALVAVVERISPS
ncbi:hypothetical protein BH18ACT2_BH18ACT2_07530 [soil metagenome]